MGFGESTGRTKITETAAPGADCEWTTRLPIHLPWFSSRPRDKIRSTRPKKLSRIFNRFLARSGIYNPISKTRKLASKSSKLPSIPLNMILDWLISQRRLENLKMNEKGSIVNSKAYRFKPIQGPGWSWREARSRAKRWKFRPRKCYEDSHRSTERIYLASISPISNSNHWQVENQMLTWWNTMWNSSICNLYFFFLPAYYSSDLAPTARRRRISWGSPPRIKSLVGSSRKRTWI